MPSDGDIRDYTVETEPSLEGLLRFCESRPADEEYSYTNSRRCPLGRYHQSIGREYQPVFVPIAVFLNPRSGSLCEQMEGAACHGKRTYGALANRVRKLMRPTLADRCRALLSRRES